MKLEPHKSYFITQIDYIQFLFIEYADNHHIVEGKIYNPLDFFENYKSSITILPNMNKANVPVMRRGGIAMEDIWYYDVRLNTTHDKSFGGKPFDMSFYAIDGNWLSSGSGDGASRWMIWENLAKMPQFYFTN